MRILTVEANPRERRFEIRAGSGALAFPYALVEPRRSSADRVTEVVPDPELGDQARASPTDSATRSIMICGKLVRVGPVASLRCYSMSCCASLAVRLRRS